MRFIPLSSIERAALGFTHLAVFSANDLTEATANTDQSFNLAPIPLGAVVEQVELRLVVPFEDLDVAGYNDTQVDVGDTGSATRFLSALQVNRNGTEITAPQFTNTAVGPYAASQYLTVNFNGMSGKSLVDLDKGELHVLYRLIDPAALSSNQPRTRITK